MTIYDITIIGGGPVGLFTAFYAHLRNAKVKIIDSLHQLGGQPATLYPEKEIFDIPAYPSISGEQLTRQLCQQLQRFDTTICLNEIVETIKTLEDGTFVLQTNVATHHSKSIILAVGGGSFKPRTLSLPGMTTYENIHYFVSNMMQYKNKNITILGGGDSAVDWALTFEKIAKSVTLIHRRPQFRAMEHSVSLLQQSSVNIMTPFIPIELHGSSSTLQQMTLQNVKSKETYIIDTDHLFVNYGFHSTMPDFSNWPVSISKNRIIVDSKQQTSTPGIFAVGDCCTYDGKVDLIASGFGEGPTAVNNAMHFINPNERIQPMHSTSLEFK